MRFIRRRIDYTTRMHMKRRMQSVDYRFLGAMIGLSLAVGAAVRFL